jgi:hypothetical protein
MPDADPAPAAAPPEGAERQARAPVDRFRDRLLELESPIAAQAGQALAHKIDQLEIQRLRSETGAAPDFSLGALDDRLMELGTLPPSPRREMSRPRGRS